MEESAESADAPEEGAAATEAPAAEAAEEDPKAALKAEKQKLRNTIANLEIQLKDARGELSLGAQVKVGRPVELAAEFERAQLARLPVAHQVDLRKIATAEHA